MTSGAPSLIASSSPTAGVQALRERAGKLWARVRRKPVRNGAVLGGILLTTVAGAPLAARVWEAFWSLPYAGRITLCAVGLAMIVTATVRRSRLQLRQRAEQARLGSVIAVAWAVVIAVVGSLVTGAWWVMGSPAPTFPDPLPPRALDALATRAFAIVAGLGAAALLVINYRRQRTTEADAIRAEAASVRAEKAAEREITKLFNERFTAAYTELGSEHAAVRLGAVHALAHLADDAPSEKEVQMVIDVLCAYLRMPYPPAPDPLPENAPKEQIVEHREQSLEFASFRQVRHTIIRVIGNHLREPTRWRGKNYDFTGVVFDGGDLSGAHFSSGTVSFSGAEFIGGRVSFNGAHFTGGAVDFSKTQFISGQVDFDRAEFSGGIVSFDWAKFSGGLVFFRWTEFSGGQIQFRGAEFTGGQVDLTWASGEHLPDPWWEARDVSDRGWLIE